MKLDGADEMKFMLNVPKLAISSSLGVLRRSFQGCVSTSFVLGALPDSKGFARCAERDSKFERPPGFSNA